jgi:hypothetical protein
LFNPRLPWYYSPFNACGDRFHQQIFGKAIRSGFDRSERTTSEREELAIGARAFFDPAVGNH